MSRKRRRNKNPNLAQAYIDRQVAFDDVYDRVFKRCKEILGRGIRDVDVFDGGELELLITDPELLVSEFQERQIWDMGFNQIALFYPDTEEPVVIYKEEDK